jgi:hypothetical protein
MFFLVLEILLKVYPTFKKMVICDAWQAWQDSGTPKAKKFKNLVLVDYFWNNVENIMKDLQPFYIV